MPSLALSDLLGAPVYRPNRRHRGQGARSRCGSAGELQPDSGFVVKTRGGDRLLRHQLGELHQRRRSREQFSSRIGCPTPAARACCCWSATCSTSRSSTCTAARLCGSMMSISTRRLGHDHVVLKLGAVDVGARGAIRRLLKGVVPAAALQSAAGEDSAADDSVGIC